MRLPRKDLGIIVETVPPALAVIIHRFTTFEPFVAVTVMGL